MRDPLRNARPPRSSEDKAGKQIHVTVEDVELLRDQEPSKRSSKPPRIAPEWASQDAPAHCAERFLVRTRFVAEHAHIDPECVSVRMSHNVQQPRLRAASVERTEDVQRSYRVLTSVIFHERAFGRHEGAEGSVSRNGSSAAIRR